MTTQAPWSEVLQAPRCSAALLRRADIPKSAGVYAWFRDGECVYVGKASVLQNRLSSHLSRSLDLSRSTLRASIAVRELGVTRAIARSRPTVMTADQVQVVTDWIHGCQVAWIETIDPAAADELERRLHRERMPILNRI